MWCLNRGMIISKYQYKCQNDQWKGNESFNWIEVFCHERSFSFITTLTRFTHQYNVQVSMHVQELCSLTVRLLFISEMHEKMTVLLHFSFDTCSTVQYFLYSEFSWISFNRTVFILIAGSLLFLNSPTLLDYFYIWLLASFKCQNLSCLCLVRASLMSVSCQSKSCVLALS